MAVAANADDYTVGRLNIFFPAHNNTPLDGNLTGQCVTLVKWFMAEMTSVPSPFSARGHARYVGKTLVAQGYAVEVPYSQRRRGDIICYEYGEYGHIAVQLSGGRVFEQNVNLGGVQRKLVDGAWVYASRIGSENEAWRKDQHVYRIKSYNEGGIDMEIGYDTANQIHQDLTGGDWGRASWEVNAKGKNFAETYSLVQNSQARKDYLVYIQSLKDKPTGNAPTGTYLRIDDANIVKVK